MEWRIQHPMSDCSNDWCSWEQTPVQIHFVLQTLLQMVNKVVLGFNMIRAATLVASNEKKIQPGHRGESSLNSCGQREGNPVYRLTSFYQLSLGLLWDMTRCEWLFQWVHKQEILTKFFFYGWWIEWCWDSTTLWVMAAVLEQVSIFHIERFFSPKARGPLLCFIISGLLTHFKKKQKNFINVLSQWDSSQRNCGLPSPGKASCDSHTTQLRAHAGCLMFP